jgi:glycosyltransferase involved in cell wall biosynthesis
MIPRPPAVSHSSMPTTVPATNRQPIAIVIPTLGGGGAERVTVNLANELARRGRLVDVVPALAGGSLEDELDPVIHVVGLKARRLRGALLPLAKYLRTANPAAVLACMWPMGVIALGARRMAGVKARLVAVEHTMFSADPAFRSPSRRLAARMTIRGMYPGAEAVVNVSLGAADDLSRFSGLPRDSISVIYNPVVGARASAREPQSDLSGWWSGSHRRLLAVGSLSPVKDHATLLNALFTLRRTVDARLLILGEGERRDKMAAQIRALGLDDAVFMPGFVKDTAPYFERADLMVLSSTSEALPTVLIEALAAGTPIVSTDCPSGPREILAGGRYGRLVPVGDGEALGAALAASLAAEHDRRLLIERSRDFSIDEAVDQYERLLIGA